MPLHLGCFLLFTTLISTLLPRVQCSHLYYLASPILFCLPGRRRRRNPSKILYHSPQSSLRQLKHHTDLSPTEGNERGLPGASLPEDSNGSFSSFVQALKVRAGAGERQCWMVPSLRRVYAKTLPRQPLPAFSSHSSLTLASAQGYNNCKENEVHLCLSSVSLHADTSGFL